MDQYTKDYVASAPQSEGIAVSFGKFRGKRFEDVPNWYLEWIVREGATQKQVAAAEIERRARKSSTEGVEVTGNWSEICTNDPSIDWLREQFAGGKKA